MQVSILRLGYSLGALRLQLISYSKTLYWATLLVKVNITLSLGLVESRPLKTGIVSVYSVRSNILAAAAAKRATEIFSRRLYFDVCNGGIISTHTRRCVICVNRVKGEEASSCMPQSQQ